MSTTKPEPPSSYREFIARYPKLGEAWEALRAAESDGPLDDKTMRLVKLGVAIGAQHVGAVHSAVRKAVAAGVSRDEIEQAIALAATTIGLPSTVAANNWVREQLE